MKALRFHSFGSPDVLAIEEIGKPTPGPGETLVQVQAAGINPSDISNVAGKFKATTLPRVPGRDFAGIALGGPWNGRTVWGSVPGFGIARDGSHAEYAVVPDEALSIAPPNLLPQQAAAVGVPFTTAWGALMIAAELQPGEAVLITGAAGSVGRAATQIALWKGARVIGGTLNGAAVPGLPLVVDTANDMPTHVFALTEGKGADIVFDTVGGSVFEPSLKSLGRGGRQVAISSPKEPRVSLNLIDFYHNESRLIGFDSYAFSYREAAGILDQLRTGFESGALIAPQVKTVDFENAIDAYKASAGTKTVLTF